MKRDLNLIRTLLLKIEADEIGPNSVGDVNVENYPIEAVDYHLRLLLHAGFIEGKVIEGMQQDVWMVRALSWAGHDFLDNVRDERVWSETTKKIGGALGTAGLEVVKAVAVSFAKQHLGLPL